MSLVSYLQLFIELANPYTFANKYYINSEIFSRVLFSRNFAYAKFLENEILAKWRNHCRLMIKLNNAIVANFKRRKYVF